MSAPKNYFSGTGTGNGKAPAEQSKFVQTCNRLSLFLKEKGNLRDLITAKSDATAPATVDLLSNMNEKASKSENIIPQYVILDSSSELQDSTIKAKADTKPKTAQMTIFYGGEILVVDDVPADRARDLMQIAQKGKIKIEAGSPDSELESKGSDLPIARRASLHKFLAKRKDRATVRAPYHYSPGASSSGKEHTFDLNN